MLITSKDVRNVLTEVDTNDDELLALLIEYAQGMADRYCNRVFEKASSDVTRYFDGGGEDSLFVQRYPIVNITSLYDDPDRDYTEDTKISSDDYIIYKEDGKVRLDNSVFNDSEKNVKLVYNGGYTAANLPKDLKLALIFLTTSIYVAAKGSVNAVEGGEDRVKRMEETAYKVLDKYKRLFGDLEEE